MRARMVIIVFLSLLAAILAAPAYASSVPALPHAFYGIVSINDSPAPAGTQVEVRGEGVSRGSGNPVVTLVEGQYGSPEALGAKLIVQGNVAEGTPLSFYVNGVKAEQNAQWYSGEVTELNLTVTAEAPPATQTAPPPPVTASAPAPEVATPPATQEAPVPAPAPETPTPGAPEGGASKTQAIETPKPAAPAPPSPQRGLEASEQFNWIAALSVIGAMLLMSLIVVALAKR